jgi:hypothetical protein
VNAVDSAPRDGNLRRRRSRAAAILAAALVLSLPAALSAAPAPGGAARPEPPPPAAAAKSAGGGFFIVDGDRDVPIPEAVVLIEVKGRIRYYRAPLGTVPETRAPAKIRDTFPADGIRVKLLRLKDDGLIFSWDTELNYFDELILFMSDFDSIDANKVMTWSELEPGLYSFVEQSTMGIGKACFTFRIVP